MKKVLYSLMLISAQVLLGQSIKASFDANVEGDSVHVELKLSGDGTIDLGSSNFVYTVNKKGIYQSQAKFYTSSQNKSYSIWDYVHQEDFEHILLSRVHQPKNLLPIKDVSIGEVSYRVKDKCDSLHLHWDTSRGDIRSLGGSIKTNIDFIDASIALAQPLESPNAIKIDVTQELSVVNAQGNIVEWYRDDELVATNTTIVANEVGEYYAKVSNGCEVKQSRMFKIDKVTSNEELVNVDNRATLFPNPVKNIATLQLAAKRLEDVQKVLVIDKEGQEIKELTSMVHSSNTELKINTWDIAQGVYFVKIVYSEDSEVIRFIY